MAMTSMASTDRRRLFLVVAIPVLAALFAGGGLAMAKGVARPMASDAHYYLQIARSLSVGDGYRLKDGFWPGDPTMTRSPLWPFAVAAVLRVARPESPDAAMRLFAVALNACAAGLVAAIAWRLLRRPGAALAAGLACALHPTGLYLADSGGSEPAFLVAALAGTLWFLRGGGWRWPGVLCLGLACLARANFVILPVFAAPFWAWREWRRTNAGPRAIAAAAAAAVVFLAPSMIWAGRNYAVSGSFPVLSTLRGQTFYGGNNPVVARFGEFWGYWVFPDLIPGEAPMAQMARTMSERDVDVYYFSRGIEFARARPAELPRLLLGKLVRAYVPVPWKWSWGSAAVSGYRFGLLVLAAAGAWRLRRRVGSVYGVLLAAMAATNVATVLLFWGCARFAFALEPFLLPLCAAAVIGAGGGRAVAAVSDRRKQARAALSPTASAVKWPRMNRALHGVMALARGATERWGHGLTGMPGARGGA